jgi:hypothetical protein
MFCKSCHYALQGLSEPRCPECGGVFDPNDPTTYIVPTKRLPRRVPARLKHEFLALMVLWAGLLLAYALIRLLTDV